MIILICCFIAFVFLAFVFVKKLNSAPGGVMAASLVGVLCVSVVTCFMHINKDRDEPLTAEAPKMTAGALSDAAPERIVEK